MLARTDAASLTDADLYGIPVESRSVRTRFVALPQVNTVTGRYTLLCCAFGGPVMLKNCKLIGAIVTGISFKLKYMEALSSNAVVIENT